MEQQYDDELGRLRQEVAELRRELTGLRREPASAAPAVPERVATDRRSVLKLAGGALVGGAVVGALANSSPVAAAPPGSITLITPVRVMDSRAGFPPLDVPKGQLQNGETVTYDLSDVIPSAAEAALLNLTATNTNAGGWFAAYEGDSDYPGVSSLNWWMAGSNICNFLIVPLSPDTGINVRCAGQADIIIDVFGYTEASGGGGDTTTSSSSSSTSSTDTTASG
jgi:hypothetical protein